MLHLILLLQVAANSELGYRMTLPEDFVPFDMADMLIPLVGGDLVGCWAGEGSQTSRGAFILCVRRLRTEVGQLGVLARLARRSDGSWESRSP